MFRGIVPVTWTRWVLVGLLCATAGAKPSIDVRAEALRRHAVPVRTLALDTTDFSDLEQLRQPLAGRRVVLLGEQTHGDGTTFAAKIRLFAFLHQQLGFDVLVFESGFYDVSRSWKDIQQGAPIEPFSFGVSNVWSQAQEMLPLWSYLGQHRKDLEVAGCDPAFTGQASYLHLKNELAQYFDLVMGAELQTERATVLQAIDRLFRENQQFQACASAEQVQILTALARISQWLQDRSSYESLAWLRLLRNCSTEFQLIWHAHERKNGKRISPLVLHSRDREMANNLLWLANVRYPGKKIVVWAASGHVMRNRQLLNEEPERRRDVPMGHLLYEALGNEMYSVGFTAFRGEMQVVTMPRAQGLETPPPDSLETVCHDAGLQNAWIDFRQLPADLDWLKGPLHSRPLGYVSRQADWTQIFDAMFYTDEMKPAHRLKK